MTRVAAMNAIRHFYDGLRQQDLLLLKSQAFIGLFCPLYQILTDDDDEIRTSGAAIVSSLTTEGGSLLSKSPKRMSLSAPAATKALFNHVKVSCGGLRQILKEAIWRLTDMYISVGHIGTHSSTIEVDAKANHIRVASKLGLTRVCKSLRACTQGRNVIFEEEKQNLFLDPVSDAEDWHQVLANINSDCWVPEWKCEFTQWIVEGLESLTAELREKDDGPLGWVSKADTFAMIMRVLYGARIVMCWGKGETVEDGAIAEKVRYGLKTMYSVGCKASLHPYVLLEIRQDLPSLV